MRHHIENVLPMGQRQSSSTAKEAETITISHVSLETEFKYMSVLLYVVSKINMGQIDFFFPHAVDVLTYIQPRCGIP